MSSRMVLPRVAALQTVSNTESTESLGLQVSSCDRARRSSPAGVTDRIR